MVEKVTGTKARQCANCGGIHFGSVRCPYIKAPCAECGEKTIYACSDCLIETGSAVHICDKEACRAEHDKKHVSGTDGPTGLPAAQELLPCAHCGEPKPFCLGSDKTGYVIFCSRQNVAGDECWSEMGPYNSEYEAAEAWNRRAPQAAAPGGVAPTTSLVEENKRLREALERGDDDRTTADWNLIDRWARAALVIIPSHDVWRTALLRIADEHKVYKGHGDHDTVPACSAEEAQSLARTALRNGEPG